MKETYLFMREYVGFDTFMVIAVIRQFIVWRILIF